MGNPLGRKFRWVVPVFVGLIAVMLLAVVAGCAGGRTIIKVDGSSTVFPIMLAMAEEFQKVSEGVHLTVGISGTGGGFTRFCNGEIDIADASRPIKPVEVEACDKKEIKYIELPVAFDGLSVTVHPDNDWADFFTLDELKSIWEPGSEVSRWSDIRADWPDKEIMLVGPDTDSGTFDYFTKVIVGEAGSSRSDYTASPDDNVLVQAIAGEGGSLGYFGYAYVVENTDKLKVVPVDGGSGPVFPTDETVSEGTYFPLSRPLFVYVNAEAAKEEGVAEFVRFFLDPMNTGLVEESGYVELSERVYDLALQRFEQGITGSVFGGEGSQAGISFEDVFGGEVVCARR